MFDRQTRLIARGARILRRQGPRTLARKAATLAVSRLGQGPELNLHSALIADSQTLDLAVPTEPPAADQPLTIGWICTPPALGSGGHTTMFRMIEALERAGHRCRLYLYDRHDGDPTVQMAIVRQGWPQIRAAVLAADQLPKHGDERAPGLDACVATSWESAHVLATLGTAPMQRCYFIQDYEPYFYPRGSEYALAEDSYRFGFHHLALGSMVTDTLRSSLGVNSTTLPFGCDSTTYHLLPSSRPRSGVVCYARPGNPRRGWIMAELTLRAFHARHPDVPITIYGANLSALPFPAIVHPHLSPDELNRLYNHSVAGLALSFTNVTLVAEEMLCAGTIPVANFAPEARACLDNPFMEWSDATPAGLARALSRVVSRSDVEARARSAAASVDNTWSATENQIVTTLERLCRAQTPDRNLVAR